MNGFTVYPLFFLFAIIAILGGIIFGGDCDEIIRLQNNRKETR